MIKNINLGSKESAIKVLQQLRDNKYDSLEIKILNTHIKELNNILGRNVFKNNVVYANATMLWEVIQPLGGKGKHNYHNLSPENVYDALSTMRRSENVIFSYDNRYVIVTLATIECDVNIVAIITLTGTIQNDSNKSVTKIITVYPKK